MSLVYYFLGDTVYIYGVPSAAKSNSLKVTLKIRLLCHI